MIEVILSGVEFFVFWYGGIEQTSRYAVIRVVDLRRTDRVDLLVDDDSDPCRVAKEYKSIYADLFVSLTTPKLRTNIHGTRVITHCYTELLNKARCRCGGGEGGNEPTITNCALDHIT
jgi:hypothetical protein